MPGLQRSVLSAADASAFATSWFAAWNRHDLDAMMAHYHAGIEHSSPFIARYNGDATCAPLVGKAAVRAYFARALERNPTLRFDPVHVAVGVRSVALVYRRMTGELAVETFEMQDGLVRHSVSHYGT
jgi:ketosteroid isomerase-like protein